MVTRNDLSIYNTHASDWWNDDIRWVRILRAMVPGRLKHFDPIMGDWTGREVLDLGCAGGFMAEALADRGARVTGIDPAAGAIEAASAHAITSGHDIRYDVGVGEALPYADDTFDAVVCVDVLEHVADLGRVLTEVSRVLRPGGLFMFDTINRNPLARFGVITMAEDVLRILPRGTHDPDMFITPAELTAAIERAGMNTGALKGLGPVGLDRRGDPRFGPVPFKGIVYMGHARNAADT